AFRHHRNNHTFGVIASPIPPLRAQRLPASQEQSRGTTVRLFQNQKCSTPSGITGTITILTKLLFTAEICAQRLPASQEQSHQVQDSRGLFLAVLNAFRHHRNNHWWRNRDHLICEKMCSTPSGITGTITIKRQASSAEVGSAQRLPASQEQSLSLLN